MKNFRSYLNWMSILMSALAIMAMSACASTRVASTLKPSGGDVQLSLGQAKFSIAGYEDVYDPSMPVPDGTYRLTPQKLSERAGILYPGIFSDDWTALPVKIRAEIKNDSSSLERSGMITGFTLGLVPFQGKLVTSYKIITDVRDEAGERMAPQTVGFDVDTATWVTLFTPLGCIPVPGQADLPRDTVCLFIPLSGDPYGTGSKYAAYHTDCLIEAIVKNLRSIDSAALERAHRVRRASIQEVVVDGRRFWSTLAPTTTKVGGKANTFSAILYQERPNLETKPYAEVIVARRNENNGWSPVTGYLRSAKKPTTVSVLMENGSPARVVMRTVEEPALEDFVDTPDLSGPDRADNLRWSNGMLLEAKNRSLERLLRDEGRSVLLGLVTRIEKSILDLNEQAERAKDRAQTMVEKDEGDPAPDRELSILCRQRIEVLKPILAAIKQEAAARRQEQ